MFWRLLRKQTASVNVSCWEENHSHQTPQQQKKSLVAGDTFKDLTSLHAHIQQLQWEHLPNESWSEQPRNNRIHLVHSTTSADSLFRLDYPIVTSPKPTILTNKPTESFLSFVFCCRQADRVRGVDYISLFFWVIIQAHITYCIA